MLGKFRRLVSRSTIYSVIAGLGVFIQDYNRFILWSAVFRSRSKNTLGAKIVRQCHIIEKGLALKDSATTLSRFRYKPLISDLDAYYRKFGIDATLKYGVNCIQEYSEFVSQESAIPPMTGDPLSPRLRGLVESSGGIENRLTLTVETGKNQIQSLSLQDMRLFFKSRHSIRQFSGEPVDLSLIEEAVGMAIYSPSACNRQPWKVYALQNLEIRREALDLQGGNRGFTDDIGIALVVTADMGAVLNLGERRQPWVDGGMFAMSLVYALHSLGLGTCCLNWSKLPGQSDRLRRIVKIPKNEDVVMMIAVGHLKNSFKVAKSMRKPSGEILVTRE